MDVTSFDKNLSKNKRNSFDILKKIHFEISSYKPFYENYYFPNLWKKKSFNIIHIYPNAL